MRFPDGGNTGPVPVLSTPVLKPSGPLTVTRDGTILSGLDITGPVVVSARGVTIDGCRITAGGPNVQQVVMGTAAATGLTIRDTEIAGGTTTATAPQSSLIELRGHGSTILRVNAWGSSGDGIRLAEAAGVSIIDSWIHGWVEDPTNNPHCDGIVPGESTVGPWSIIGNTIDMWVPGHMTSVISIDGGDSSVVGPIVVSNNWLAGGGYTVAGSKSPAAKNLVFTGNRFSTVHAPACGQYGPMGYAPQWSSSGNLWSSSNVWADGPSAGRPVSAP